jgi:peptidyl-prolyl cis-trans isomerase D
MLSAMREKTKFVMLVLLVAMVGWIVFDLGMGGGQGTFGGAPELGSVNGRPIRYLEFQEAYRQIYDNARAQNPGVNFTREEQREFENQAFEQLVQSELLKAEYRRRGISITDRELVEAVRQYPPPELVNHPDFQTEGQFDPQKYERFLSSPNAATREFLMALEARYRDELPRVKLLQQVTGDIYASDAKLWQIYRDQHDSVTVRVLVIDPRTAVADASITMTDDEVRRHYEANRRDFEQPARALVRFVALSRLPTTVDSALILARARALRDSIIRGADFAEVARSESSDSVSAREGGLLGMVRRGQTVPQFERAVWSLPLNSVSEPVATTFGAHLIRVERRSADSALVRHLLLPWALIGERLDTLEARADSLDRYAAEQTDGRMLDSVATRMGLQVVRGPALYQGTPYVLGRYRIPDVGVWAFEATVGETSPVIETDGAYYVFRLDSVTAAGPAPLSEVEAEVRAALQARKKRAAAEAIARDAEQRLLQGQTMDQVATAMRLGVTTLGPFTRTSQVPIFGTATPLVGAAFRLRVGERSGLLRNENAFFFLQPERRVSADSTVWRAQVDAQRGQITRLARQVRVQSYLASLRRGATIRDRRAEVLRPVAQDETPARR